MTETVKHTPGPWKLLAVGDRSRLCPADQNNQSILTLEDEGSSTFACVYENSDAYLIAAAPDLLEALKLFVRAEKMARDGNPPQDADELIKIGDAAISKAETPPLTKETKP